MSPIKHNECESEIRVDVSLNTSDAVPGLSEAFNDYTRGSKIEEEDLIVANSYKHQLSKLQQRTATRGTQD